MIEYSCYTNQIGLVQDRECVFIYGKNAFSALRSLFWKVNDLCSNKWGYAFFGVWLRLELHTFYFRGRKK